MKRKLWKWTLKMLSLALSAADEWVHAQQVKLREDAEREARSLSGLQVQPAPGHEYDRKSSAARERAIVRARKLRLPRLKYQHGEFVRTESHS